MNQIEGFPWTLIPALTCFAIGFIVQFRLKRYVDREKVLALKDLSELYPNSVPPRKILNAAGQRLYLWFYGGLIGFGGFVILTAILYAK